MKRTAFQWLVISSLLLNAALAEGRTRPRYGGTLRIEVSVALWDRNGIARSLTTETLTRVGARGQIEPWLAVKWESQNHDRRWVFALRPGVSFHDGTPFNASTVSQMLNGCAACPWKSVQASGDNLVFELESPSPLFPAQMAMQQFGVSKPDTNGAPIGTGPMRVAEMTPRSATLQAFENYWNGRIFVDRIEVTAGRTVRDQWLDLGVGKTDVADIPAEQLRRAQQDHLRPLLSRNDELIAIVMNASSATMQSTELRQAIAESVDRISLLNFIFQRQGEVSAGLLPNWLSGYASLFPANQNLAHARQLKTQVGTVPTLTFSYDASDPSLQLIAERIALSSREAGITLRTVPAPAHWDLTLVRVRLHSTNPSVALEDIVSTIGLEHKVPDDSTPEALYQRERDLVGSYHIVPLLYVPRGFAATDRVHNWKLNGRGLPDFDEIWAEERK
ncbi:MAG TPA: ABC transporter substrate-binding protein [Terriglobales bacterium]